MLCWSRQANISLEDDMFGSFATLDPRGLLSIVVIYSRKSPAADFERLAGEVFERATAIGLNGVMA